MTSNNSEYLSLWRYWQKYIKGVIGYETFRHECKILFADRDFKGRFGKYRARKLTPRQIEMLNEEFLR